MACCRYDASWAFLTRRTAPLCGLVLAAAIAGCTKQGMPADPAIELGPDERCEDYDDSAIATFGDPALEAAVRAALGGSGSYPIRCGFLPTVAALWAEHGGITDLSGIQNLPNLHTLDLRWNSVTDLRPLAGLDHLATISLAANFDLEDISGLRDLPSLWWLDLSLNQISDIEALGSLSALAHLWLRFNSISDLDPLGGLTRLRDLSLSGNWELTNIEPLLQSEGIGAGDAVDLQSTAVSCADIDQLQSRGVTVASDCPPSP